MASVVVNIHEPQTLDMTAKSYNDLDVLWT